MYTEQLSYASRRRHDPFMDRIAQLHDDLDMKRQDYQNAQKCAERLTGRAHKQAKANALSLRREAAELAAELARLGGGR